MREIKFRAWDGKQMVYFQSWGMDSTGDLIFVSEPRTSGQREYELIQYTGLKDKNGKDIYEGDVVKHKALGIGKVTFAFGCWHWSAIEHHLLYPKFHGFQDGGTDEDFEIIGNIYENPELLKV